MKNFYSFSLILFCALLPWSSANGQNNIRKVSANESKLVDALLASYPFNANVNDESGNGFNGTASNQILTSDRFGNPQSAYEFTSSTVISTPFTAQPGVISIWFQTTSEGTLFTWGFDQESSHPNGITVDLNSTGLRLEYAQGSGSSDPPSTAVRDLVASGLLDGNWHHLVIDLYPTEGFILFDADNQFLGEINIGAGSLVWNGINGTNGGSFQMGDNFIGKIDDIQIFSGNATVEEIESFYTAGGWPIVSFDEFSLIASYDFGGDGFDLTGNGFELIPESPTLIPDRFGNSNNAYRFVQDTLRLGVQNLPVFNNMSISAWFRTTRDYSGGFITIVDVAGTGGLAINENNILEGSIQIEQDVFVQSNSGVVVNDGEWHHGAMSYDGFAFNIYVDGKLMQSVPLTGNLVHFQDPTFLNVGLNYRQDVTTYFEGDIDDVNYYNYGIDEFEVEALYSEGNWPLYFTVADWPLDNGFVDDLSGNALTGTLNGTIDTLDRLDNEFSALYFDGSTDYVNVPHNDVLNVGTSTDFAVSGWFNTSASSGVLFDKSDGNTGYLAFFPDDGTNQILFFMVQGGVGSSQVLSSPGYNDGQWHHIVCVADRDAGMRIYIDGNLNTEAPGALSNGFSPDTNEDFLIGVAGGVANANLNTYFSGLLDDFKVFNQAVTAEQVRLLFGERGYPQITSAVISSPDFSADLPLTYFLEDGNSYGNAVNVPSTNFEFVLNENLNFVYGDNNGNGYADLFGTPIPITAGLNFVEISSETKQYSANLINSVGFIGSATTGNDTGWLEPDTDMTFVGGGTYELNNIELFDGAWKIRANDDWDFANWGFSTADPGNLVLFGEDIPIQAGLYDIAVDVINKTYSVTPVGSESSLQATYLFSNDYSDNSGNGNNGTAVNTTFGNNRFGSATEAAIFNGTDAYISVPDSPNLNFGTTEDIIISGWFNTTQGGVLFDKSDGSNGFFASIQETGELLFFMIETSSSTNSAQITTNGSYNDGNWHHYVIQITRATNMEIWIDGEAEAINNTTTDAINPDMTEDFLIGVAGGVNNAGLNSFFSGSQDDIRIFNQALSLQEILDLYSQGGWPIIEVPRITSINPRKAKVGEEISIAGNNFSVNNEENIVSFNGIRANVISSSITELIVEVPLGASFGPVYVSTNGLVSQSARNFNVIFDGNGLAFDSASFVESKIDVGVSGNQQGAVIAADFDQDGNLDIGAIASGTQFSVLRNLSAVDGEISFDTPVSFNVSSEIRIIEKGDFNGDGKWDIAIAHGNTVSVFRNISTGAGNIDFVNVFELTLSGNLIRELEVGDMNGDGKQDIVITEQFPPTQEFVFFNTYTITVLQNNEINNVSDFSIASRTDIGDIFGFKLTDLNGDRKLDLVTSNSEVLLNTGDYVTNSFGFSSVFSFADLGTTVEITTGDYDNDGKNDFAVSEDNGARIIGVFANATTGSQSGDVNFFDGVTFESGIAPTTIKSADFNGDGLLDIASSDIAIPGLSIYRNTTTQAGDIRFENRFDYPNTGSVYDIVVGDFNNDGKVDAVSSDLAIFRNNLQSAEEISVPSNQPSNLSFSEITSSSLTLSFDAAASHDGNYLVVRNALNTPAFTPVNGVNYEINDIVSESRIAYIGPETNFIDSLLNQDTRYFYRIYSYNGSGAISLYLTSSPLTGDEATLPLNQLADEPTEQPTNFTISNFDETTRSFQVNYTAPASSVDGFLVVRTLNTSPTFVPLDGQSYGLGAANSTDSIVYIGTEPQFIEQDVLADNDYQYLVFSYNGSDATTNYLQTNPLEGNFDVPSAEPSLQPTNFSVNSVGPNSVNFSYTASANTTGYLILRNETQIPTNVPDDFVSYTFGDQINEDVVVYSGSLNSIIDNNLNPGTQYFYAVFAFNGSGDLTNYLTASPLTGSLTTSQLPDLATAPQAQATGFDVVTRTENSAEIAFAASDASGYLIVRSENSNSFFSPADGITYSVNARFGNAVITYIGANNTWTETGLLPLTNYNFKIFAFNGTGDEINYLQSSPLQGQLQTLASAPNTQATNFTVSEQTFTSFTISFDPDFNDSEGYLAIRKLGQSLPSAVPSDGIVYTLGEELAAGEVVAALGSTIEIAETDLASGDTISYTIYAYNGESDNVNYNTVDPLSGTAFTLSDNSAPLITNIQYDQEVDLGGTVNITVDVVDNESGVNMVEIQYIVPGTSTFDNPNTDIMDVSGSEYSYEISNLTEEGLEFRISSSNGVDLEQTSPIESVVVVFPNEGLSIPYSSFGSEESNYRIVSTPLTLNNNTIDDVFGGQLGEYGDLSKWRMFRYSNEVTSELSGSTSLIPGRGYWLIANGTSVSFTTGPGKNVSASVDDPYEIVLSPGWNQIGNPYPYDVSWSDIQEFNNEEFELRIFNGSFTNGTTLTAFSGGFVNWPNSSNFTLRIPRTPPSASQNRNIGEQGRGWDIDLLLENGDTRNELTGFGMHESANNDIDSKDQFNLPHFMSFIDLKHPLVANGYNVSKNIVEMQGEYNWTFDLESNLELNKTTINWQLPSTESFDRNKELFLWDPSASNLTDMKRSNQYQLRNSSGRGLKVIYGSMDYVNSLIEISSFHVSDPFPNPTSGILSLDYFIPEGQENSVVTIELFDLKGSLVNSKRIEVQYSGVQSIRWDLHSDSEKSLRGVYLMRVNNGVNSINKKIVVN